MASSFYHTLGYNVSGYNEMEIEFYFIAVSMDRTGEDFWVQYYNGSSWLTVAIFNKGIDFENLTWYVATVTITDINYNFPTNAKLRFMCDASGNVDDVYIDAITWRGMSGYSSKGGPLVLSKMGDPIAVMPEEFSLRQNHPNPFNPATTISFTMPEESHVKLEIFNITGQKVETLVNGTVSAGVHSVIWDGTDVASGIYFYRIETDEFIETKKMVLLK